MPVPPGEIGLHCRHHLAALWWLGLLYRRPVRFKAAIVRGIAGGIAFGSILGIAGGVGGGIALGIAVGATFGIAFGIAWSVGSLRAYYHLAHLLFL